MAHTPFEGMNYAVKVLGEGGTYSALKNIEDALKRLQITTIEGIPLLAIGKNENVFHDDLGNILIQVSLLQEQIQIGTMFVRDNAGTLEKSVDGATWEDIGTVSGTGDMLVSVYDADSDGRVEAADVITDGTNTVNPAELRDHLDNHPAGDGDMLVSVYDADSDGRVEAADVITDGTNTVNPAELRDHLDNHPAGGGDGDMLASVYDTDADGRVEAADTLTDGTNTVNPAELRALLDNPPGGGDMTRAIYDVNENGIVDQAEKLNDGSNIVLAADVRDHIDNHPTSGDMLKTTYDTDDDGIVDKAEELYDGTTSYNVAEIQLIETNVTDAQADILRIDGKTEIRTSGYNLDSNWVRSLRIQGNNTVSPLSFTLPFAAGILEDNADIIFIDYAGMGITVTPRPGENFFPGGETSLSNVASPVAGDYLHILLLPSTAEWMVLDSRGAWI